METKDTINAEQMARMKYEKKEEYIPQIFYKGKTYEQLETEANAKQDKKREDAKKRREEKKKSQRKTGVECEREAKEKAKKAREYGIKWRKDNPDKVKKYNKKQTQRDATQRDKQRFFSKPPNQIEYKSQRASCPFCGYSGCNCGSGY